MFLFWFFRLSIKINIRNCSSPFNVSSYFCFIIITELESIIHLILLVDSLVLQTWVLGSLTWPASSMAVQFIYV